MGSALSTCPGDQARGYRESSWGRKAAEALVPRTPSPSLPPRYHPLPTRTPSAPEAGCGCLQSREEGRASVPRTAQGPGTKQMHRRTTWAGAGSSVTGELRGQIRSGVGDRHGTAQGCGACRAGNQAVQGSQAPVQEPQELRTCGIQCQHWPLCAAPGRVVRFGAYPRGEVTNAGGFGIPSSEAFCSPSYILPSHQFHQGQEEKC